MLSHRGNLNLILIDDPLLLVAEGAVFSLMNTVNYLKAPFGKGSCRPLGRRREATEGEPLPARRLSPVGD